MATAKGRAGCNVAVGQNQVSLDTIFVFRAARTFATGVQGFGTNHRTLHTALSTSTFAGSTMRCEFVSPVGRTIALCFVVYQNKNNLIAFLAVYDYVFAIGRHAVGVLLDVCGSCPSSPPLCKGIEINAICLLSGDRLMPW